MAQERKNIHLQEKNKFIKTCAAFRHTIHLTLSHNHPNKTMIDIIGVITPAQKQKNNAEILAT